MAIEKGKSTTPGPDGIHNDMFKHLNNTSRLTLLQLINNIWESDQFPELWKDAFIIPIPKPRKDTSNPNNHRPISLTSCLCKLMERMMCARLRAFLESNNIIINTQCGARNNRSTTDHLVALDTKIREAFANNHHAIVICFDIEKAYDTAWKHGVLQKLNSYGLKGHLPQFIQNFLQSLNIQVKIGSTLSEKQLLENGFPQGSLLSVLLFLIAINDIAKDLPARIENTLYMDDFTLLCSGPNITSIERQLQLALNQLSDFEKTTGFKFSTSKTVCMHFCRKRKQHRHPELTLNNTKINVVETNTYLGLLFDSKLSWIPHIKQLKDKCNKATDILRSLSHTSWGSDRSILLQLYRALIRSKLDYGCEVYSAAHPSALKMLEPIQNLGLRLSTGAFRTSPVTSLHIEANELPLSLRRQQLTVRYALRLQQNENHPTYDYIFHPQYHDLFAQKTSITPTVGLRLREFLDTHNIQIPTIYPMKQPKPFWLNDPVTINTELATLPKSSTPDYEYLSHFRREVNQYDEYTHIYTDGSKTSEGVGCAFVTPASSFNYKLHKYASIFTAELYAILKCLHFIKCIAPKKFLILTDSLSSLQTLKQPNSQNPIGQQILQVIKSINTMDKSVCFMWVPGHVGIAGNEKADELAKSAICKPTQGDIPILSNDMNTIIKTVIHNIWQRQWEETNNNKLKTVKENITEWHTSKRLKRKEEVILTRLRIGHTRLTHKFLFEKDPKPMCTQCNKELTVEHILVDCKNYQNQRLTCFAHITENNLPITMKNILGEHKNFRADALFNFLDEINLYKEI